MVRYVVPQVKAHVFLCISLILLILHVWKKTSFKCIQLLHGVIHKWNKWLYLIISNGVGFGSILTQLHAALAFGFPLCFHPILDAAAAVKVVMVVTVLVINDVVVVAGLPATA